MKSVIMIDADEEFVTLDIDDQLDSPDEDDCNNEYFDDDDQKNRKK